MNPSAVHYTSVYSEPHQQGLFQTSDKPPQVEADQLSSLCIVSLAGRRLMWFLQFVVIESKMCPDDATQTLGVLERDDPPSHLPTHPTHHGCTIIILRLFWLRLYRHYISKLLKSWWCDVCCSQTKHFLTSGEKPVGQDVSAVLQRFIIMMSVHIAFISTCSSCNFGCCAEFHPVGVKTFYPERQI